MAYTKITKDMNIIAALDDEPNDVGGLTASELKAKFDEGGLAVKESFNILCDALDASAAGTTATKTEVDQLHEAGAVKADFEKLHAIQSTAQGIDECVVSEASASGRIFVATYGVTNYMDIATAISNGRLPVCFYDPSGSSAAEGIKTNLYTLSYSYSGPSGAIGFLPYFVFANVVGPETTGGQIKCNIIKAQFKIASPFVSWSHSEFSFDPADKQNKITASGLLKGNGSGGVTAAGAADVAGFSYTTTAPTAANTDGIKVCVLSEEPATKYGGWLYLITE